MSDERDGERRKLEAAGWEMEEPQERLLVPAGRGGGNAQGGRGRRCPQAAGGRRVIRAAPPSTRTSSWHPGSKPLARRPWQTCVKGPARLVVRGLLVGRTVCRWTIGRPQPACWLDHHVHDTSPFRARSFTGRACSQAVPGGWRIPENSSRRRTVLRLLLLQIKSAPPSPAICQGSVV